VTVQELLAELARRQAKATAMGGPERVERRHERGALTARERIERLLDPDSFFEVGLLNHSDVPGIEDRTAADGKVCGIGAIDGRPVMLSADDATVLAGAGGRVGGKKLTRLARLAMDKGFPIIDLGEAGGARIPDIQGSDGLSSMTMGTTTALRMRRVPMVTAILGECFGAPAWAAALSDFVVQVKGTCMAVSGPRVLEIATGEKVTNEELGGWEVHARVTGLVDRVAEDEDDCFRLVREFLAFLPSHAGDLPPVRRSAEDPWPRQATLARIIPDASKRAYDMTDVIRTIVDDRHLFLLKPEFDRSVITGLARLDGHPVGIVASQPMFAAGAMGPDGCDKCTSFICLCDSFNIPLVFLHDTPGFFVGRAAEQKRIPGKIINFVEALALSTVPKVSVVVRKSYGMAYSNMAGPNMGADFVFAWPTADISFMAPEVAANVVHYKKIHEAGDPAEVRQRAVEEMRLASAPWRAAGLHFLDDVIAPGDTRRVLVRALEIARGTKNGGRSERRLAAWPTSF
jgi:acetyl-CoA carboxylase carboxyltransferase component